VEVEPRPIPALGANQVWAYDFVFDACANGQQLKCLTVIDEYTRECLAIDVAGASSLAARQHSRDRSAPPSDSCAAIDYIQRFGCASHES